MLQNQIFLIPAFLIFVKKKRKEKEFNHSFESQVEEMHRLYNLQKKLMQETEKNGQKQVNLKQNNLQESSSRNDPITNEVSGSNSAENTPPIHSTIHPFEEAKNTAAADVVVEGADVEVELTLSIGRHCTRKKQRSKSSDQIRKLKESDDRMKEETQEINASNSSSSSVYQENRRPHWLMQDLSLNRT